MNNKSFISLLESINSVVLGEHKNDDNKNDEEPLTSCCGAAFAHPDMDICSLCGEHASVET